MENWYVIQVRSGHEHQIAQSCRFRIADDILKECFIPEYKTRKKYRGQWHDVQAVLFKGYVFMISDQVDELFNELKKIPDLTKMIGKKKDIIYPLPEHEVHFLQSFSDEEHLVDMSYGFIEGDKITITQGPLMGKEGSIRKIDRHKRIAYIEVEFLNQISTVKIGLEIISKT